MNVYFTVITAIGLSCGIYLLARGTAGYISEKVAQTIIKQKNQ